MTPNYFPRPWQIERGRNPSYLHSAWIGFYFVLVGIVSLIWAIWIRHPWMFLKGTAFAFWNLLKVLFIGTTSMLFAMGRTLLYGLLGGMVTNNKTPQEVMQEALNKFLEANNIRLVPVDEPVEVAQGDVPNDRTVH